MERKNRAETIGRKSENKVHRALDILRYRWKEVVRFIHAEKNGELDREHIDFLIILRSNLSLALQVKSSRWRAKIHLKKYPHIKGVIWIREQDTPQEIAERIKKIILLYYKKIKRVS
ncbi:MAG: hypothetical protein A2651_02190 [Candidatus Yanofskybacteria bacterium RIFCSPHIGHO2_01_FULL_42_12]|uniref:Uncharacterized protein n=1 Tax=Candidatus Yanofskybacteria bacterium RIFCSPLOWO2_01_FULL_42_49 TaxID=1802694 RepID=A0A1F8GBL4_9BACT|nr:MAG: hypothetical protein A2651_02190 [Candidatus Yanofskybacteria bacterium RIFCSPHIGHO2_01_FULL_42_12]OGN22767.1 MAG: hypothetical protein A2918_01345 [Candidatus Yanofskybacteria bacterium RIFCSPLOWO2_01_FULL_42_49]